MSAVQACAAARTGAQAHGDRHAGRHLHDREDRVEAARGAEPARQRHADHGQVGVRRGDARERGGQAGAGDDHAQPAHARVAAVVGDGVGVAVRGHDADLERDARLLEHRARLLHLGHVGLRAHDDPDARRGDLEVVERGLGIGLREVLRLVGHVVRSSARRAMSRRSCLPSKSIGVGGSIGGGAGGGRRVAERRDVQHAAAGGHEPPVRRARCRRA